MSCIDGNCACSPEAVDLAFRESEPYIEREIADRSYKMRRYLIDLAPVKTFPDGIGYTMSKVRFFGDIGPQYDGFEGWRKEQRSRPDGDACGDAHDACGYVWEEVGHGFEELHYHLMKRDLKTVPICVEDIRTFWEFKQYQNLIFQNLTEISMNMKEQLVRNALIGFSVKHVITSAGLEINSANPYELPNITGVTVGKLNFRVLKRLYNALLREAGSYALDTINGRPAFGLMASDDVLDDMFYEDPDVRVDLRESSFSDQLLTRYNFMDSVRGMYVTIPDMYAPRYKDDGTGNLIRVFPYERDVMIQSGTRPAPNPEYETAPYELVLILTRDIFSLRSRKPLPTAGGETDFEAETGMFDWRWHNPERWCDPNRRLGYYFANGRLGIEPGDFTDIPAILVQRRPAELDPSFWPAAVCPEDPVECNNSLIEQGCPCPQIVGCCEDFTDPNVLQFALSTAPAVPLAVDDPISVELNNGGVATGTVSAVSVDQMHVAIDFGEPVECCPELYVQLVCIAPTACSASVVEDVCSDPTRFEHELRLQTLLRDTAAVAAELSAIGSDGVAYAFTISAIDTDTLTYTGALAAALPEGVCIETLCIPQTVDATCPLCQPQSEACTPPIV